MLLSILESSFEYFFETAQAAPSSSLHIGVHENVLHYHLSLSRPADEQANRFLRKERLISVQTQLQSYYAGLHQLDVNVDTGSVLIDLKLPLYASELIKVKTNTLMDEVSNAI